jgi:Cu/Ag efflux pump CusA
MKKDDINRRGARAMNITRLSISRPIAVGVLMAAAAVVGIFGFSLLPVNLLPDITYPLIKVYVNWRGATPEDIEENVAEIIEPKMATVDDLDYLDSSSTEGLYSLQVNFGYAADRDVAYQDVTGEDGPCPEKTPGTPRSPSSSRRPIPAPGDGPHGNLRPP